MAALLIGGEKITQLINRCRIYELLFLRHEPTKTPFTANLIAALLTLYIVVLRFLADAKKLYDQTFLARTLGSLLSPEVLKFVEECKDLELQVDREARRVGSRTRSGDN